MGRCGSLADGLEEFFDGPIVDGLEIGAVGGAEDQIGDVGAECVGGGVSDGLFDPDDCLIAGVEALRFFVGIGERGDFGLDKCAFAFGFVVGFLFVVVEHDFRGGHVGGFDFGEGGAGGAEL